MQNTSHGHHPQKVLTNKVTQWPSMPQSRKDHRPIISRKPAALDTKAPRPPQLTVLRMGPPGIPPSLVLRVDQPVTPLFPNFAEKTPMTSQASKMKTYQWRRGNESCLPTRSRMRPRGPRGEWCIYSLSLYRSSVFDRPLLYLFSLSPLVCCRSMAKEPGEKKWMSTPSRFGFLPRASLLDLELALQIVVPASGTGTATGTKKKASRRR